MIGPQCEVELLPRARSQLLEQVCRRLQCSSTVLADEMAMRVGGQVIGSRAVAEVRVHHDTESFELFEVAVDRRGVDVGSELTDGVEEFLGSGVDAALRQRLQYEAPRGGDADAILA